jgi:hypothetical protein
VGIGTTNSYSRLQLAGPFEKLLNSKKKVNGGESILLRWIFFVVFWIVCECELQLQHHPLDFDNLERLWITMT